MRVGPCLSLLPLLTDISLLIVPEAMLMGTQRNSPDLKHMPILFTLRAAHSRSSYSPDPGLSETLPRFSTDEGQCWKAYNFTEHPLFFAGLTSEPGTKAMNISVWGYRPEDDGQPMWVAVTIDFTSILSRQCGS